MNREGNNVVFRLINENSSNAIADHLGNSRRFPRNYAVPARAESRDDEGKIRVIRYVRGQDSIYAHEQSIDRNISLSVREEKPNFQDGLLMVPETQYTLIEFLRKHPLNEDNQGWGLRNQKPVFKEHRPEVIARSINEKNKNTASAMRLVYEADFTTKILPIARYLGFDVNKDSDLVMYDVTQYASQNPASFVELLSSAKVERYDEVCEAADRGIIVINPNSVNWFDGRRICTVPKNYDSADYFAEISFDRDYQATWAHIKSEMRKQGYGDNDEENLSSPKSEVQSKLESLDTEDLFNIAKEEGVLEWKIPNYVCGSYKAKGKEAFIELMESDESVRNFIIAKLA